MKALNRLTIVSRILSVSLTLAATLLFPAVSNASHALMPGYVATGDSIDAGVGATGGFGYVPQFRLYLEQEVFGTAVGLHNLSQPGATTMDIAINQLGPATAEIQAHRPFGVVVSWGGGGNDLLDFILSPQAASCMQIVSCLARVNALLDRITQTVDRTIRELRSAAGPESMILVRTQYNSLLKAGCDPDNRAGLGTVALEGLPGTILDQGLNDRLRAIAAKHHAKVIEIFGPFFLYPNGLIADDCIHPNDAGHDEILNAAKSAFEAD